MTNLGWESPEQVLEFAGISTQEADEFLAAELAKALGQVALINEAIKANKEKP